MRRYTKRNKNGEKLNFWLSYSDMMAALLLVFILILSCTLLETRATYEAKQAELEEKEQIILNQQSQIDTIVGVRGDLIDALSKEFSGNDLSVKVDAQSGAITFDSTLLFGYNDDKLQDSGKTFLAEFLPKYFSVLLGKDFSPYVAEIIIEGHTDTDGGYMYNLATVYKGNIIKNLIMDCQSYTKYRPNETTGGIFVSWRRKEELPTGA